MTKPSQILEKGWTREHYAINKFGNEVDVNDPNAVAFCLIGAVSRSYFDGFITGQQKIDILYNIHDQFGGDYRNPVVAINDDLIRNQEHAIEVMRKAEKEVLVV